MSIVILGIVSIGMAEAFITNLKSNTASEVRSQAAQVAQRVLDDLRTEDPTSLPTTGTTGPVEIVMGPRTYDVYTTYCAQSSFCSSVTTRHLRLNIRYHNREVYRVDTVFTQLR